MNPLFVNLREVAPRLLIDLRYAQSDNFLGRPVRGYERAQCLITSLAAHRLSQLNDGIRSLGVRLKVFDAYRPQHAVDDLVQWAGSPGGEECKSKYFSDVLKSELIPRGYIAARSSHSRGSTVDLTLCALGPTTRTSRFGDWLPNGEVDMGTCFDYFGPESHTASLLVPWQARANRRFLTEIMEGAGFQGIEEEWWHFTLREEPFPSTYFDFPMSA